MSQIAPRLSASLILLSQLDQPAPDGFDYKVCLLKRGSSISNANATVFPGGNIDPVDYLSTQTTQKIHNPNCSFDELPIDALKYCAIRETFEEVGILLADPSVDTSLSVKPDQSDCWRKELMASSEVFPKLYSRISESSGKTHSPPLYQLHTWITPETQNKRFDTTFFLHILPSQAIKSENPLLQADGTETASAEWMTPKEALEACLQKRQILLFPPQVYLLAELLGQPTLSDVRYILRNRKLLTILPRAKAVGPEKRDLAFLYPGDAEYEDGREIHGQVGSKRHRTYAEAVYKNNMAVKPKQPLHVKGLLRVGIGGMSDLIVGDLSAEARLYRPTKL